MYIYIYGFHIFSFHFLASFSPFQKKKTKKLSVVKIDELISCTKLGNEEAGG